VIKSWRGILVSPMASRTEEKRGPYEFSTRVSVDTFVDISLHFYFLLTIAWKLDARLCSRSCGGPNGARWGTTRCVFF